MKKNTSKKGLSLIKKFIIFFIILIFLGIIIGLINSNRVKNINNLISEDIKHTIDLTIIKNAENQTTLIKSFIKQKAIDIANQIDIYLKLNPNKTIKDLQDDPVFTKIAIQKIYKTGYTAIHDTTGINYFHKDSKVVNKNLSEFKQKLPNFWKIIEKSFTQESEGYYQWINQNKNAIQKYMHIIPIKNKTSDNKSLLLAITIQLDEFTAIQNETYETLKEQTKYNFKKLNTLLENINKEFILLYSIMGIGLFLIISFIYYNILRPIHYLSEIANSITSGKTKLRAKIKNKDEIGDLADSFNEMTKKLVTHNNELKKEIDKQTEKIKSFISITSHQLRTPLTGTKWFLELLLENNEKNLTSNQLEYLKQVFQSNERMIDLVNDLLSLAKIEDSNMKLEIKKTNIYDTIQSVLKDNIDRINKYKIKIINKIKPSLIIQTDESKIRQVFHNLITNAIKYSNGKIKIYCKKTRHEIKFLIKDNGIGIPLKQQKRIFSKFFRADNALTAKIEGTGLGLYIAKLIIEAHGGIIGYKSKENKGTTFFFTIKLNYKKRK